VKVSHFKDARHFASWFGLTPKEYSSGSTRKLGHISKRGDRYLRMLLTHRARAVLRSATLARQAGRRLDGLRLWITHVEARSNHNKAACAMVNKLACICYASLRDVTPFGEPVVRPNKKLERTAFATAA
jgi:transposase